MLKPEWLRSHTHTHESSSPCANCQSAPPPLPPPFPAREPYARGPAIHTHLNIRHKMLYFFIICYTNMHHYDFLPPARSGNESQKAHRICMSFAYTLWSEYCIRCSTILRLKVEFKDVTKGTDVHLRLGPPSSPSSFIGSPKANKYIRHLFSKVRLVTLLFFAR